MSSAQPFPASQLLMHTANDCHKNMPNGLPLVSILTCQRQAIDRYCRFILLPLQQSTCLKCTCARFACILFVILVRVQGLLNHLNFLNTRLYIEGVLEEENGATLLHSHRTNAQHRHTTTSTCTINAYLFHNEVSLALVTLSPACHMQDCAQLVGRVLGRAWVLPGGHERVP